MMMMMMMMMYTKTAWLNDRQ